jgi:hypothetical protein
MTRHAARLDMLRTDARRAIDEAAGRARARYITVAPGQEGVYLLKAAQAEAYRVAGYPENASAWPLITMEAQARGMTPQSLADEILALRDAWTLLAARIEAVRLAAKQSVATATTPAAITAARNAALTELELL